MNNRVERLRSERAWTRAELGARLCVSRRAVEAIETGKYDPSVSLALKIAQLFEVPVEEIFERERRC
jgi:putative transcriptional regulator